MATITVENVTNAPIERVWSVWTEPTYIVKWCHASDDWEAPHAENDLRVGGVFTIIMAAKDGSSRFDFTGTYTGIVRHERIEYTMTDGRKVSVRFENLHGSVKVTETFEAETTHSIDQQRVGWQAILDNFKKCVESAG